MLYKCILGHLNCIIFKNPILKRHNQHTYLLCNCPWQKMLCNNLKHRRKKSIVDLKGHLVLIAETDVYFSVYRHKKRNIYWSFSYPLSHISKIIVPRTPLRFIPSMYTCAWKYWKIWLRQGTQSQLPSKTIFLVALPYL